MFCCYNTYLVIILLLSAPAFLTFTGNRMANSAVAQPYRVSYFDPKCADPHTGRELYVGESFTRPGRCVRVQCLGTLQLWEDNCQEPALQGNCTQIPRQNANSKDYPRCCPMYECKTFSRNGQGAKEETRTYDQYGILRKTDIQQVFVLMKTTDAQVPGSGLKTEFEI